MPTTPCSPRDVALEYYRRLDAGEDVLALFASDARLEFPKCATAQGHAQIRALFANLSRHIARLRHVPDVASMLVVGSRVALEGRTAGRLRDGSAWDAASASGRWCAVLEIEDALIRRCTVYLDPDFTGADAARYPWAGGPAPTA